MKKFLNIAWLVLFCLPVIAFTSCEKEDEETALFKDYSVLMGKTRQKTIDYIGVQPVDQDSEYQMFVVSKDNVDAVMTWYSYFDGVILDGVVVVESYITEEISDNAITNYLNSIYDYQGIDEDGWSVYIDKKKNLDINYLPEDHSVMYVDTKHLDASRATMADIKAAYKARRNK